MIVIDASAVVDALIVPAGSDSLRHRMIDEELNAPALLDFEVVGALRGMTSGAVLSEQRAVAALTDFDDLAITRWPASDELRRRWFALRHNLTTYDAAYVALAEALDCVLVTRDGRLARSSGHLAEIEEW